MPDCEYKDDVLKLMNSLVNILAIVKHFQNKIKDWLACQNLSTPTEEQVLDVVRKNYDLTLKLQDSLDHYERYVERPKYNQFFTNMVREVVLDTRKQVYVGSIFSIILLKVESFFSFFHFATIISQLFEYKQIGKHS